jgi:hypothetical protein
MPARKRSKTPPDDPNAIAPDPARVYERAKPEAESGMGRLDNNDDAVPTPSPDATPDAVTNAQQLRQLNAEEGVVDARKSSDPVETAAQPKPRISGTWAPPSKPGKVKPDDKHGKGPPSWP